MMESNLIYSPMPIGSQQEASALNQALTLIRELLTSVDQQVLELEHSQRLQEIQARMDPRAEAQVRGGGLFRVAELMRRQLIHEGTLLWKTGGSRLKGGEGAECELGMRGVHIQCVNH